MLSTKAKIVAICITMAVTVVSFVCSTLAYFTDSATASGGMIAAGRAEVEIVDITYPYGSDVSVGADDPIDIMPGYEISKKLVVRNIGDLPLYIRVRIQSEITLADAARGREAEIDPSLVGYDINIEHWEYRGVMAESDGTMGWMWECPNFCHVDGQDVLMVYSTLLLNSSFSMK